MSVSFHGTRKSSVDFSNGLASRILKAMGYPVGESTDGEMPLKAALEGIEKAKETVSPEDRPYLDHLAELALSLKKARRKTLTWS